MSEHPHDLATVIVALGTYRASGGRWFMADELRGMLQSRLGIDVTTQQVAAWLNRMTREDLPRFERRHQWGGAAEYAATTFARTELENKFQNLRVVER